MILVLLFLVFIGSDFNTTKDIPVGNCKATILHDGGGNWWEDGDRVVGLTGSYDCCDDLRFCYIVSHTGISPTRYEMRVTRKCEGGTEETIHLDYIELDSGEFDILCFSPDENNCNCEYSINLYSNEHGVWLSVWDNGEDCRFDFKCETECVVK